ncbi:MAG: ATP-dependent metallopeptidase FtsH/Yme1/Tma family protein [Dehalococcoidia bacterium]|nr:ATP-dependent metallopeptidase FtsH/Yme1/Tma family protein [Dehalococcoidia bacterium]
MNQRWLRSGLVYMLILVAVIAIFYAVFRSPGSSSDIGISELLTKVRSGEITKINVDGDAITAEAKGNLRYRSKKEPSVSMIELLNNANPPIENPPDVTVKSSSSLGTIIAIIINILPFLFLGFIILFMMRQAQGSNSQAMSFGRSRARMFVGNRTTVTFSDVAGVEEAKQELQEIVEFLMYPERFAALGARIPKGVLLVGPPGTGKTLLAKAVAGEAGVPFFSISGSEFVEMFVGVGASRVRDLFEQARRNSPCIIFIDEIDAVGRHRGAGLGGGHDEREQTLNQILVEMDGFDQTTNIIIIAATNRPDILDPALLRPGRFDRRVVLDAPDIAGRKSILNVHVKGKPLDEKVDLEVIAKETAGFSGADLANLVNEAALLAARRGKKVIGISELEEAVDRVIAGPERKSRVITDHEKKVTAYHEAGHALVAYKLKEGDVVHKITIVPRGMAGGYTRFLPSEERHYASRSYLRDRMAISLGGRAAEEIIFGELTSGASDDLKQTTGIARRMITEWGMSDRLGPRTFGQRQELVFLGREISEQRDYGDKIADEIDSEIRSLVEDAYARASKVLVEHKAKLHELSKRLLIDETMEGKTLQEFFAAAPPPLDEADIQQFIARKMNGAVAPAAEEAAPVS